jgi:hypothetical protein
MMHARKIMLFALVVTLSHGIVAMNFGSLSSIGGSFEQMGRGMIEGFGHCYHEQYNLKLINDTPIPMNIEVRQARQFMGAESEAYESMLKGLGLSSLSSLNQTVKPYQIFSTTPEFNLCFGKVFIDPLKTGEGGLPVPITVLSGTIIPMITVAGMSYLWERGCDGRFFCKSIMGSEEKSEQETNYYHTYTFNGAIGAEFMGPGLTGGPFGTTTDFEGVFYNKRSSPVQLTFKKNGNQYTVSLDGESFNTLASDKAVTDSIRSESEPRNFIFTDGTSTLATIPIPAQGIGQKVEDTDIIPDSAKSTSTEKKMKVVPMTTTYEIMPTGVGIQGYNMGNYDQFGILVDAVAPVAGVGESAPQGSSVDAQLTRKTDPDVYPWRSLNPIPCSFWYKSTQRATQDYTKAAEAQGNKLESQPLFVDDLEQVWVAYDSGDFPDKPLMQRLQPDVVSTINIIRPTVKKGLAHVYVFSIATASEDDARAFLKEAVSKQNLLETILGIDQAYDVVNAVSVTNDDKPKGSYTAANGVTGYLLYVDNFISYGSADASPRFYEIMPPLLDAATFAQTLLQLFSESVAFAEENAKVDGKVVIKPSDLIGWLKIFNQNRSLLKGATIGMHNASSYAQQLETLVPDLMTRVKAHGAEGLFVEGSKNFSNYGYQTLYLAFFMPRGFYRPPLLRMVGTNVTGDMKEGDKVPTGWPQKTA